MHIPIPVDFNAEKKVNYQPGRTNQEQDTSIAPRTNHGWVEMPGKWLDSEFSGQNLRLWYDRMIYGNICVFMLYLSK